MTEPAQTPPQNLALLKAVTVGLGLLLVGGVALLCVLLVTRGDASAPGIVGTFTLAPGERLLTAADGEDGVLLTLEGPDRYRVVTVRPDGSVERVLIVTDTP